MNAELKFFLPNIVTCSLRSSICKLLPYEIEEKVHSKLSDGIKEYKLLLVAARDSISHFLDGNLFYFDALVGENSCQIRATLLSIIAHHYELEEAQKTLQKIVQLLSKIEILEENITADQENITLHSYLKEHELDLLVNKSEFYLVISYVLTKVRVILPPNPEKRIVRNESTVTTKVKEISPVGSSFARDLVKKLRSLASDISVRFVQEIPEMLALPEYIADRVSDKYCTQHDKFGRLKCLPCFWYTLLLMKYSLDLQLPIVLIIKQIHSDINYSESNQAIFYYNVINGKYLQTSACSFNADIPALIVMGSSCRKSHEFPEHKNWRDEILNYDPIDLILSYAAAHRQYPDETKDILITQHNDQELMHYQSIAKQWGCTLDNPSLFFLVHAFCDKISNINLHTS